MIRYICRRLLLMIPIVICVTFLIFFIMDLMPGTPAQVILGQSATPETVEALNKKLGYDKPFLYRFGKYIYDIVVNHDMGTSYSWRRPVWNDVMSRLPVTILVSLNGMLVAILLGIPIGVVSAVKQYSKLDRVAVVASLLISAIPAFWLAMMLILIFAVNLGWLPTSGVGSPAHFIMPAIALGLGYAAQEMRFTRSAMLETVRQDYIDTARSKGVPEKVVVWRHALQNALLPVITITGSNFGALIGGAIVTETIFAIPGLGSLMVTAIYSKDVPIVCGCVVVIATLYSLIMLLVDLTHAMIDPRVKARYAKR